MKKKPIMHKRNAQGFAFCNQIGDNVITHPQWRKVTCLRCLAKKDKK